MGGILEFPIHVHHCVRAFFSMVVISEVGDRACTLFWKDRWLHGQCIADLAPHFNALIPKRRTVLEDLTDQTWISDVQGVLSVSAIVEFLELWDILSSVDLQPGVDDSHIWKLNTSGQYTAKSAYEGFFQGAVRLESCERIWKMRHQANATSSPGLLHLRCAGLWIVWEGIWSSSSLSLPPLRQGCRNDKLPYGALWFCMRYLVWPAADSQYAKPLTSAGCLGETFFEGWCDRASKAIAGLAREGLNSMSF